jgi:hypothetical protein
VENGLNWHGMFHRYAVFFNAVIKFGFHNVSGMFQQLQEVTGTM